jgi:steroid delta-isomerase-like uncharacterized protein
MTLQVDNKAVLRRFYQEFWSEGRQEVIDELLSDDYVDHQPLPGFPPGKSGFAALLKMWRTGFPDMREEVQDLIAEGDKVVGRFTMSGTHTGEFLGLAPTGRQVSMTGIDVVRIQDGQIIEFWYAEQLHDLMQQLRRPSP